MNQTGDTRRVLHVISHMEKGGAEKQLCLLVNNSRHRHVVAVLKGNERPSSAEQVLLPGLNPLEIYRITKKAIQQRNIDIVQLWLPDRVTVPAMVAAKVTGRPIISGDRCKPRSWGKYVLRDRLNYINHLASDLIVPNYPVIGPRFSLQRLLRFRGKTRVIYNGVIRGPEARPIIAKPAKLLFVGRLVIQKRVDLLIDAFPTLFSKHGITGLSIVGDGPCRNELERAAGRINAKNAIRFHGTRTDWGSAFDPSEYFLLLPSEVEGMSNTVFEAIDHGFLPIVSQSPELQEIFACLQEKPFLFDPNSSDSLIAAVGEALSLSVAELAARAAALRAGLAEFSVEKMVARYDAIYDQL